MTRNKTFTRSAMALAVALLVPAHAALANGEALPAELPGMATPASADLLEPRPMPDPAPQRMLSVGNGEALPPEAETVNRLAQYGYIAPQALPLTSRAEVRQSLMQARIDGTLGEGGEVGDSPQVLAARERSNAEMALRMEAEYAAAAAAAVQPISHETYTTTFGNERRTELVMVMPDGRRQTVLVEWSSIDGDGQPVLTTSHSLQGGLKPTSFIGVAEQMRNEEFAIVTVPVDIDDSTLAALRQAWQLHSTPVKRLYVEGGAVRSI